MKFYFEEAGELDLNEKKKSVDISQEKSVLKFETGDFILALALLFGGFLYWNVMETYSLGLGISVFALFLCSITLYYFRTKSLKITKEAVLWLGVVAISAIQFAVFDGNFVKTLNLLFVSLTFIYWVAVSAGNLAGVKLSIYTLWDVFHQTFIVPFSHFGCEYHGLKYGFSKNKYSKNVKYMLLGFVVFLPLMVFVINQLSSADVAFETLLRRTWNFVSLDTLLGHTVQFVMGIPVACYLFGLIYGNVAKVNVKYARAESMDRLAEEISFAPKMTVYTVLIAFNIIYVIFFASQMTYFLSAFQNVLPDSFTYAGYARRGFFELCKVSGVNMVLIALAHMFIVRKEGKGAVEKEAEKIGEKEAEKEAKEREPKMLRIQTALLSLMTIGLIVTALSKMYMYIGTYGLTQLRVYSSWFMVMLLFIFVVILLRQIKSFNASRIVIIGGIIGFMALSYGNVDGNIAKYNIEGYEAGRLEKIDYRMLAGLSDAAVPYLYELYKNTEESESKLIIYERVMYGNRGYITFPYEDRGLKAFNLQSERAAGIRGLAQSEWEEPVVE